MNKKKVITIALLLGVAAALIGWDIYVYGTTPNDSAMISRVVLNFASRHPSVTFIAGFLCGHLFWPQRVLEKLHVTIEKTVKKEA